MNSTVARLIAASTLLPFGLVGCASEQPATETLHFVDDIEARVEQFVPQHLNADLGHLSPGDREALDHLIEASGIIDQIFEMQAWANRAELDASVDAYDGPKAEAVKTYYDIMYGPWDRLLAYEPWLGDQEHPEGAGYYPEDMTAQRMSEGE